MNMSNNVVLNTLNVPIINDFEHLAEQLSLTQELLYFLTYKKQYCYTRKEIPKKDGTSRILYVPHLALKVVQRWILKEILEKINVSNQAMAFLLAWYSLTTTLFQAVQSDVFLSDCKSFFHDV